MHFHEEEHFCPLHSVHGSVKSMLGTRLCAGSKNCVIRYSNKVYKVSVIRGLVSFIGSICIEWT